MTNIPGFKAYDIRGKVPSELNVEIAYKVGRAFVKLNNAKKVVIGMDVRVSSPELSEALANGFTDAGCDVIDLGMCGTEMIYFGVYDSCVECTGHVLLQRSHHRLTAIATQVQIFQN